MPTALNGKRIGVLRFEAGSGTYITPIYERALAHLKEAGATLVEVPNAEHRQDARSRSASCCTPNSKPISTPISPPRPPSSVLAPSQQLIEFNQRTPAELALFGQEQFEKAQGMPALSGYEVCDGAC